LDNAQFEPRTPAVGVNVRITIDDKHLLGQLHAMGKAFSVQALKSVGAEVGKIIKQVVRQAAPVDTGALMKSMDYKAKVYSNSGSNVLAVVVGANTDVMFYDHRDKRLRRPSKYLHLVVGGFQHRGGKTIAGKRFMQTAVDSNRDLIDTYAISKLRDCIKKYVEA
jgi:hypothetical protein